MPTIHRSAFEAAVEDTIRRRRLLSPGSCVLAAVSGGPDSTALVAVLASLRDQGVVSTVHACHVDHQLRAGSRGDAEFCDRLCTGLRVPLQRVAVTVSPGGGVQAAARRARYAALEAAAAACGADAIATGHTRSDQAETVLHRLLRGSGARGLAAIPPRRGRIVRPLIDRSRAEVVAYLRERQLEWREDPSNASPRYLRNRIRREILPALDALAPGVERRLALTADLLREDDRALEGMAAQALEGATATVAVSALRAMPLPVRRRAVRRLWRAASGARRHLGAGHVERIVRLLARSRPARVTLPRGLEARAAYGMLTIAPPEAPQEAFAPVLVSGPGSYAIPGAGVIVDIAWSSSAPTPWPLELRTRRPGDRFTPLHAPGGKKLKSWLIDRKVPRGTRDTLIVAADGAGHVLAIPQMGALGRAAEGLEVSIRRIAPRATERAPELQAVAAPAIKGSPARR